MLRKHTYSCGDRNDFYNEIAIVKKNEKNLIEMSTILGDSFMKNTSLDVKEQIINFLCTITNLYKQTTCIVETNKVHVTLFAKGTNDKKLN